MHVPPLPTTNITSIRRRTAERAGRLAEDDVASRLRADGFEILAARLRTGAGEIDLVAADDTTIVFVEVKARQSLLAAAYAISPRQQARLLEAAGVALANNPAWQRENTRFDVALVTPAGVTLLRDAIRYN
jgi:putative endonuclease